MKRCLITGASGFVGSHLIELLHSKGFEVYGTIRWRSRLEFIDDLKDKVKLIEADLMDSHSLLRLMKEVQPDYVFHLAAQSYVPTSWKVPAKTMMVNTVGQVNLLEAIRDADIDPKIQIACCYDIKTRAFTSEGLKEYAKLKKGDLVLSLNPIKKRVEFKKINKIIVSNYDGSMYKFKSKSCDLLLTPNHRLLIKKKKERPLQYVEAQSISGKNYLPLGKFKSDKKYGPKELYYLIGLFIGDGYIVPCKKTLEWSGLSHSEYIKKRNEKGQFKKIEKKLVKEYTSQRAFLAIPKQDKSRKLAENVLKKLRVKFSGYEKEIYFNPPKELLSFFEKCGKYAKNKQIPRELLDSNIEYLKELFKGLIDSDGHYRKNRYVYSTISWNLVNGLIEICSKIGLWVTITETNRRVGYISGRKITSNRLYNLSITKGEKILTNSSKTSQKKIIDYNGRIWCVEVEDNHNLLVERNGKLTFCGNSSEEYGLVYPEEVPIKETNPLRPLSPYGVSKVAQDLLGYQYFKSYGMKIVRTRGFNHTGNRRGEVFVTSNFAKQVVEVEKKLREPVIYVGDLSAKRDFTHVKDMVRGYLMAIEKGDPGEVYNLCFGKAYSIKEVIDMLIEMTGVKVEIKVDPERLRPSDVPLLLGDNTKIFEKTGWKPEIQFEQTLKDILEFWRERVGLTNKFKF